MSEYKVLITETWKRAVTVDAESREGGGRNRALPV